MAADGSRGPKPYHQASASTVFLRVPAYDWPEVKRGIKREFRAQTGKNKTPQLWAVEPPTPVVAWSHVRGEHQSALMVLERIWIEPLGAISAESLAAEGHASLADYRRYWMRREGKRFTPLREVFVYRVRPWGDGDEELMARRLFERLYGEFIPERAA